MSDTSALARLQVQTFAGSVVSVRAQGGDGRTIPLVIAHGRLTPSIPVSSGERIVLSVVVRRPTWDSWALGRIRRETLTVRTPAATILDRWISISPRSGRAALRFDEPVDRVSVRGATVYGRTVILPTPTAAGSVTIAAAARPWEKLDAPARVTWFPHADHPVVLTSPYPHARISPLTPVRFTFSAPVAQVLHGKTPNLSPRVAGSWTAPDGHTLLFRPSGHGTPFNSVLTIQFPTTLVFASSTGSTAHVSTRLQMPIAPASFLRLQQLLAQTGYLPLEWTPAQADVARTMRDELAAAVQPPAGRFDWHYPHTPHELQTLWRTGEPNTITRGAVMAFQDEHHLAVDGIAGPQVWYALLNDALAGNRRATGYSYVYVHRNVPQLLTLWHNGQTVLTSPGNTGVPAAPTALGTWAVFEHIPVGRMSGTNPDGSRYDDPGIRWISYFHGGEALHAFNRTAFGTPQSLGCVELPLDAAAKIWPYTPIGTLVTIED